MPLLDLDRLLQNLRSALSPRVRWRVDPIIFQMKGNRLPPAARSMLLRQLRSLFPGITREQRALLTIYVLGEAGMLGNMGSRSNSGSVLSTLQGVLDTDHGFGGINPMSVFMLMNMPSELLQTAFEMEKSISDTDMAIVGNIKQ